MVSLTVKSPSMPPFKSEPTSNEDGLPSSPDKQFSPHKPINTTKPSTIRETCPSFARGNFTSAEHLQKYRYLSEPHVESFNFFLTTGLQRAVADMEPIELDLVDPRAASRANVSAGTASEEVADSSSNTSDSVETIKFWVENVTIAPPTKDVLGRGTQKLLPRECRELGIMYAGE